MDNKGLIKTIKNLKFQKINTWLYTQYIKNLES